MSRKPRREPRFLLPPEAFVPETPEEAQAYEEHIRGMFDADEAIYYGQRKVQEPPLPRRRRSFEEILTEDELERIMPAWEQEFLSDWRERALARAVRAIPEHNRRAYAQAGPIFNPDTGMEVFPAELDGLRRFEAEVRRGDDVMNGWKLLAAGPPILLIVVWVFTAVCEIAYGRTPHVDLPYPVSLSIFLLGIASMLAGLIGMFRTKHKYRHLDPTATPS